MPRSKNAVASRARRKKILDQAKGFYGKRKNVYTVAKNVLEKGLTYSYVGRKLKKREYRSLWIARINAAVREEGLTYSQFINLLAKKGSDLNRKVLADLAMNEPATFKALIQSVKYFRQRRPFGDTAKNLKMSLLTGTHFFWPQYPFKGLFLYSKIEQLTTPA